MGKLTWKMLEAIYGGDQFKVTPEEASEVLQKYLFTDTTWKGSRKKKGRVWLDMECRVALVCLLREHKKLIKRTIITLQENYFLNLLNLKCLVR